MKQSNLKEVSTVDRNELLEQISWKTDELAHLVAEYWHQYSDYTNWQFWFVLFVLIAPLVLLYFTIDRNRLFEIFFFGYTVNMLWTMVEAVLTREGLFVYHYFLMPFLPSATNMTTSLLPVSFLLLYQYCTNRGKNFHLYVLVLSALYAFVFANVEEYVGLLSLNRGMSNFYIFFIDVVIAYFSYWFTVFLLRFKEMPKLK